MGLKHMKNSQLTMTIGAIFEPQVFRQHTSNVGTTIQVSSCRAIRGGQRLYPPSVIPHLKLINQALQTGLRPKQVVGMGFDELQELGKTSSQSYRAR